MAGILLHHPDENDFDRFVRPCVGENRNGDAATVRSKDSERMLDTEKHRIAAPASGGIVHAVRGAVVDVVFERADPPQLNSALAVEWDRPGPLSLEVHSHLNLHTLRAVAFQSTAGLTRGVAVRALGGPVTAPMGEAVLGRLLDVVGDPRDNGPALPTDTPRRPIHASPPTLRSQIRTTEVFETGIKVRCRSFWDACRRAGAINRRWRPKSRACRNGSPRLQAPP